ncbi:MAG: methylmalonyl Co-A mutase-associated GTPase MeaB [Deltaproteobacteria bacterium]|nr:methylmalonyl Co-A mutase-associated GTPase MeaB [Deltaproteobacteria bacterium]
MLARAITLVESELPAHRDDSEALLQAILPATGGAVRLGISGVPGVGKSTFIDRFGVELVEAGHRVAVLAIDPSSVLSGGSILGDKTRMAKLSRDERAYIRPSPTSGNLGGVARKTRESALLCEAAGHDVVLVETVGVGQSEVMVREMVDHFVVLMLSGAGDELQGIKRGILEVADVLAVNKADGPNLAAAERRASELRSALKLMRGKAAPPVHLISAKEGTGLAELWEALQALTEREKASGIFHRRREDQAARWMRQLVEETLLRELRAHPVVGRAWAAQEAAVRAGERTAAAAARELLAAFRSDGEEAQEEA